MLKIDNNFVVNHSYVRRKILLSYLMERIEYFERRMKYLETEHRDVSDIELVLKELNQIVGKIKWYDIQKIRRWWKNEIWRINW